MFHYCLTRLIASVGITQVFTGFCLVICLLLGGKECVYDSCSTNSGNRHTGHLPVLHSISALLPSVGSTLEHINDVCSAGHGQHLESGPADQAAVPNFEKSTPPVTKQGTKYSLLSSNTSNICTPVSVAHTVYDRCCIPVSVARTVCERGCTHVSVD